MVMKGKNTEIWADQNWADMSFTIKRLHDKRACKACSSEPNRGVRLILKVTRRGISNNFRLLMDFIITSDILTYAKFQSLKFPI
jgi:hypothetical protein